MGNRRTTAKQLLSFRTGSEQQQIYLIENSTPTPSVRKSNRRERLKLKQKSQISSLLKMARKMKNQRRTTKQLLICRAGSKQQKVF